MNDTADTIDNEETERAKDEIFELRSIYFMHFLC